MATFELNPSTGNEGVDRLQVVQRHLTLMGGSREDRISYLHSVIPEIHSSVVPLFERPHKIGSLTILGSNPELATMGKGLLWHGAEFEGIMEGIAYPVEPRLDIDSLFLNFRQIRQLSIATPNIPENDDLLDHLTDVFRGATAAARISDLEIKVPVLMIHNCEAA